MPENHLFEYAVIRVVPRVEREEFLNVGLVLYCAGLRFLQAAYIMDEAKLQAIAGKSDLGEIETYLQALTYICEGKKDCGPIAALPLADRFRWLTATRSTVVQISKVHPGFCAEPHAMLKSLMEQLVL